MDVLGRTTLSSQFELFYHTRRPSRRLAPMARSSGTTTAFSRIAAGHVADLAIPVVVLLAVLVVLALYLHRSLIYCCLQISRLRFSLWVHLLPHSLEMAVFPSFLLTATLVRLVLNIATTRLISQAGAVGSGAAGDVEAFSSFVAADNLVVGIVVFAIIAVIQFVVLTAGIPEQVRSPRDLLSMHFREGRLRLMRRLLRVVYHEMRLGSLAGNCSSKLSSTRVWTVPAVLFEVRP